MLSVVEQIAVLLPVLAYAVALRLYGLDLTVVPVFGACGFSTSAFILWLYSKYVAALYLREREERDRQRLRHIMQELAESERSTPAKVPPSASASGDTKTFIGPRSVARIAPVLPALMSLVALLAGAGNVLLALSITVYQIVTD